MHASSRPEQFSPALHALATTQGDLLSAPQCREHGASVDAVRGLIARGVWQRAARGVVDTAPAASASGPDPDRQRRRAAWLALLSLGPGAVSIGACALALHGVAGLPAWIRPEAAVEGGQHRADRSGIRVRAFGGARTDPLGAFRIVPVDVAISQAVPELSRHHGLAVLDSCLHQGLLDPYLLEQSHRLAWGRRGVARQHVLWEWADARAESPLESFARLDCCDADVPPDVLQLPISVAGRSFRADMGWRLPGGRWLIAEIDGVDVHGSPDAAYADRERQNSIVASGRYDVLRFTAQDLGTIGSTVRSVLRRPPRPPQPPTPAER